MVSRVSRAEAVGLVAVTFIATAGVSVFAVLAGLGGKAHLPEQKIQIPAQKARTTRG
jgi:hypothetical protein